MKIQNARFDGLNDFYVVLEEVGARSVDQRNIVLPYYGRLPSLSSNVVEANIYFNVQFTQKANVVFVVKFDTGKTIRQPVCATNDDIKKLLDSFFEQEETGLDPYWLGVWQANYIGWRKVITEPDRLLDLFSTLSDDDINKFMSHLKRMKKERT